MTSFLAPLLIAIGITITLAVIAWNRRPIPGAVSLALFMIAVTVWLIGYTLELISEPLDAKILWAKVQYIGIVSAPLAGLAVSLIATGRKGLSRRAMIALSIPPIITLLLVWTNEWHGAIWRTTSLPPPSVFPALQVEHGVWFWVHVAYSYAMLLVISVQLVRWTIRAPALYRGQAIVVLLGGLAPWIANVIYVSENHLFPGLDLTPFAFAVTGVCVTWGLFRFRLLDLVPVARDAVVDRIRDAVIVLDNQQRIVDLNPSARKLIGEQAVRLIGNRVDQGAPQWLVELAQEGLKQNELRIDTGSSRRWFDVQFSTLTDRHGRPTGKLVVLRDVTARMRWAERLRRQHSELAALHDTTLQLVRRLDQDSLLDAIVARAATLFGTPHAFLYVAESGGTEMVARVTIGMFVEYRGYHIKRGEGLSGRVWESGRSMVVDDFATWNGRTTQASWLHGAVAVPLKSGSEVIGVLGLGYSEPGQSFTTAEVALLERVARLAVIALDNARLYAAAQQELAERTRAEAERLALERQMQHTQKLESLGILAGGIAHDFNNLLQVVLGHAALALMDLDPHTPTHSSLTQINMAARRAAELTQQLLAYAGKGRFLIQPLNLTELIYDMTPLLRTSAGKVALETHLDSNLLAIMADATQIRQVVMNLVINAAEAMGERSGRVTISTSMRQIDRTTFAASYGDSNLPEGMYVCFEVADTGIGMDEATQARIFDPFFSTKFTGRGLGLAAVMGIVRSHQGAVQVQSVPGEGTRMLVMLPGVLAPVVETELLTGEMNWRGSGVVLIVDDEPDVRGLAAQLLERLGFRTLTARDGRAAVEIFQVYADDLTLVLLDLTMPEMSGDQVFRELRKIRAEVPVVFMSGYSSVVASDQLRDITPAGFLQKPFTLDNIRVTLQRALADVQGVRQQ